ncbi:hypothetical protein AAFF_G00155630 [Aldrovandia affinis]|uniref:Uncharacterized protein n=1 Tax=Aldrovandia affinis TaxID=143900 RepID=A0AAD7T0B6_9TELE|nr:hypothetical protein AAFF_G00155630 [Aldrovandia affinis]
MPRTPAAAATVREIQERATPSTPVPEVAAGGNRKWFQVCKPSDDTKTSTTCAKYICTKHTVTCPSCAV